MQVSLTGSRPMSGSSDANATDSSRRRLIALRPNWASRVADHGFQWAATICGLIVLALVVLIVTELWKSSHLAIATFGLKFFTGQKWDPVAGDFGAKPFIFGTLVSSGLALLIAVPLAIGVAVFITELCPQFLCGLVSFLT